MQGAESSGEGSEPSVAPSASPDAGAGVPWYKRLYRNPWLIAFVVGAITLVALRPFLRHEPEPPPVLYELPSSWRLVDHEGQAFGSEELRGEVWIASFFFTSCPSICPRLMSAMLELQDRFEAEGVDVKLVSFTVDPENDTPQVLAEYGRKLGADLTGRWTMVTGDEAAVRSLVVDGFKLHVGDKHQNSEGLIDIAHVGRLVLVDRAGGVRGLYETDAEGLDEAFHRATHVIRARE